jgi:hypothetical protein
LLIGYYLQQTTLSVSSFRLHRDYLARDALRRENSIPDRAFRDQRDAPPNNRRPRTSSQTSAQLLTAAGQKDESALDSLFDRHEAGLNLNDVSTRGGTIYTEK